MFENEIARKILIKFCKHNGLKENENSVLMVTRLDANIIEWLLSMEATLLEAKSYMDHEMVQCKHGIDRNSKILRKRTGASIPHESARHLIKLLPIRAVNVLQHGLNNVKRKILESPCYGHGE